MRNITTLWLILSAITGACQNTDSETKFSVHAEIMAAPAPTKPAPNVSIGQHSVYAYYHDAEFVLQYDGKVFIERGGKQAQPIPASVFQIEPGVWVAEIEGGQYVKVFAESGNTNTDLDGEFRTYRKD